MRASEDSIIKDRTVFNPRRFFLPCHRSLMIPFPFKTLSLGLAVLSFAVGFAGAAESSDVPVRAFLKTHCQDCHEGESAEAGLDLAKLDGNLADSSALAKWIRIYDRVQAGEMPPADAVELSGKDRAGFVSATENWIEKHQLQQWQTAGRVRGRRLTHLQLERTLHDLLGIDIPLASLLPEESKTNGFTTVADGQSLSHFQLEQHLGVVDAALDEAIRRATSQPDEDKWTLSAADLARERARSRNREPELISDAAVVWSSRLIFYGRLPSTTARKRLVSVYRHRVLLEKPQGSWRLVYRADGAVRFECPAVGLGRGLRSHGQTPILHL